MSVDKLVDSTLLDAACTYEAGKIREKLGSSAQIAYDLANGKGFGDAIAAIPSGGGGDSAKDIAYGIAPSGEVSIIADTDFPQYGLSGRRAITALTINIGAYEFLSGYNITNNTFTDSTVTIITGNMTKNFHNYFLTGNSGSFSLTIRGTALRSFDNNALRGNSGLKTADITTHSRIAPMKRNGSLIVIGRRTMISSQQLKRSSANMGRRNRLLSKRKRPRSSLSSAPQLAPASRRRRMASTITR